MSACPSWCQKRHPDDSRMHGADLGSLRLGDVEIGLALHQTGADEPAVDVFVHSGADVAAITLSVPQLRSLVVLLNAAGRALAGGEDASSPPDDDRDETTERLAACRRLCGGDPTTVRRHLPGCPYGCQRQRCGRPQPCPDHGFTP